MHNLHQVLLQVVAISVDEIPKRFQYVFLVLHTLGQRGSVLLNQLEKDVCEAHANLQQSFCAGELKIQFGVGWSD